jgi:hypothetical protein
VPINPEQIEAVLKLPAKERYGHFIKRVADFQKAWGLLSATGWAAAGDDDGALHFPLWPHLEYAQSCVSGQWSDSRPEPIPLDDLLEKLLPKLEREHTLVAVFPTPGGKGVPVPAAELAQHLEAELEKY